MSGKVGRSGRKTIKSTIRKLELEVDSAIEGILSGLITKAKQGNVEAARILLEYRLGKPKQSVDLDINLPDSAQIAILYRDILGIAEGEYKLITEGKDETIKEGDV